MHIYNFYNKIAMATPKMTLLDDNVVSIIKTTWEIPKSNPLDSGEAILLRYFEKYPHNQDKFNSFKNTPLLSLKTVTKMGVVISYIFNKKGLGNPKMTLLDENIVSIIKMTWDIPKTNPIDSGEAILFRYFEKYPHNQDKFSAFKNTPLLLLKGTPGFRTHAGRIVTVFDNAILALGSEDERQQLEGLWTKVAQNHFRRKVSKKAFNELRDVLVEVLSSVCNFNDEQSKAWNLLLDNVYHIIFETMDHLNSDSKGDD